MKDAFAKFGRFIAEEDGVTMVEYGLLAALISIAAVVAITAIGGSLQTLFNRVSVCLSDPPNCK